MQVDIAVGYAQHTSRWLTHRLNNIQHADVHTQAQGKRRGDLRTAETQRRLTKQNDTYGLRYITQIPVAAIMVNDHKVLSCEGSETHHFAMSSVPSTGGILGRCAVHETCSTSESVLLDNFGYPLIDRSSYLGLRTKHGRSACLYHSRVVRITTTNLLWWHS